MIYKPTPSIVSAALEVLYASTSELQGLSVGGGYAHSYRLSDGATFGEAVRWPLAKGEIWVQPDGTPAAGQSFLDSFGATGDPAFLEAAATVGQALAAAQKPIGGWNFTHRTTGPAGTRADVTATLDDQVTPGVLQFLIALDAEIDAAWLDKAVFRGLAFLVEHQSAAGGWALDYPKQGNYRDHLAFNDGTTNEAIEVLFRAHAAYGDKAYLASALKGVEFMLETQLPGGGWAQQYDAYLRPAAGRKFEPAAAASAETAYNVETLVAAYDLTGDARYLRAAERAADWLERVKLPDGQWARLYEIGSDRPVFATAEGKLVYSIAAMKAEGISYNWISKFTIPQALAKLELMQRDEQAYDKAYGGEWKPQLNLTQLEAKAAAAIKAYEAGDWADGGMLEVAVYAGKAAILQNYLKNAEALFDLLGDGDRWDELLAEARARFRDKLNKDEAVPWPDGDPDDAPEQDGPGDDPLFWSGKGERRSGSAENDVLEGSEDGDDLSGNGGDDVLIGRSGRDRLSGGTGDDALRADGGDDLLHGGTGSDALMGASGKDRFVVLAGEGARGDVDVIVDFEAGREVLAVQSGRLDYAALARLDGRFEGDIGGLSLRYAHYDGPATLNEVKLGNDAKAEDTLLVFDAGTSHETALWVLDVKLTADDLDLYRSGAAGIKEPPGAPAEPATDAPGDGSSAPAPKHLVGGGRADDLAGQDGNDVLVGRSGNDRLSGGAGGDLLRGDSGNDRLRGQDGDDRLYGGSGADRLDGGAGDDVLIGAAGGDQFLFGAGGSSRDQTDYLVDYRADDRIRLYADADPTIAARHGPEAAGGVGLQNDEAIADSLITLANGHRIWVIDAAVQADDLI